MTLAEQIERAKALLAEHGFKMSVDACGCCESPGVRLEHNGEVIIGDRDGAANRANFNMFEEEKES